MDAKAERKRIRGIAKKWRLPLGLDEWRLTTEFVDGALIVDDELRPDVAGCANVKWEYRQATLKFNLQQTARFDDDELEEMYVHEAMHILLNEMREYEPGRMGCEERVASSLSFAFMRLRKGL